jgi:PAS domain S-box-containing protein
MATRAVLSKLRRALNAIRLRQVFRSVLEQETPWLWHYGLALLFVLAALGMTLLIFPLLQGTPAALFYVAVMLSSWLGGFKPGLFATLLSTLLLNYFFLEPYHSFNVVDLKAVIQSGVFAASSILISYLNESRLNAKRRAEANFNAWRNSEAQLTHLTESNIIGIFSADVRGSIINANDAFLHMIGYTREDLLAGRIQWDTMALPEEQMSQLSPNEPRTVVCCNPVEKEYIRKDGSRVSILLGSVLREDQTVIGFVLDRGASKRNEAERQQAEAALRKSEERLRLAMEGAQMGTWDVDLITGKALWSDQSFLMLGYTPTPTGNATEQMWYDQIHPDDQEQVALEWQQSRQEHRTYRAEYRVIRADTQQIVWISGLGSFVYNSDGEAIRSTGVLFDITERKRDEEALRRSEERFRVSQELSLDAFTILDSVRDETGQIVDFVWAYVNPKAAEILQHPVEDLVGQRLLEVLPGNRANSELFERYVRVVETGEPHDLELSHVADGITGWFRNMTVKLRDGVAISFSDITQRKQAEIDLRESEERLRLALIAANQGLYDLNVQTGEAIVNAEYARMLGYEPDEFQETNAKWRDRLHPDDLTVTAQAYEDYIANKRDLYRVEFRQRTKSGDWKWILSIGKIVARDNQGQPLRMLGTHTDITDAKQREAERRQAEIELSERKQRLDLATKAANLGVFEWNIQTDQAVWENSRMYEMFGRTVADGALSKTDLINTAVHPEDREALELKLTEGMMQGSPFQAVYRIRRLDNGQWRWIEASGQFEIAADGTPLRLVGVLNDITDRKQAEQDLRTAEERLRLALNAARMVVWDWDLQVNQVVCSEDAEKIWGRHIGSADDFIAAIHPDDRALVSQATVEAHQHEGIFQCEYRVIAPDQTVRWLHSRGRLYFDAREQAERMIGVSLDVSKRVQIEAERDSLLRQEQAARGEAERANRIKDEFLAVLSHELRSPLNPILGWTRLLQTQQFGPERAAQALTTIERNAKLQAQLIEDLLDVSRILQGKMAVNVSSVNLTTTISAAIETVRLAAEAKNIQIHTVLRSDESIVAGDAARLQQIVWNLLTNAVKFTPQGGQVEVRLDRSNGFAQIQVQDTGKGINPEFLPYVFDYFRQEDGGTTRKFGGLGLGLALVQHLTEQHGGTVSAESAGEGQGATFTVRLPLQTLPCETTSELLPPSPTADLRNLNILVVDDEPDMCNLIVTILEAYETKVKAATSATEALAILEQWQPDLLISDIGMPEMDGYALMRQIRRLEATQQESLPAEQSERSPEIAKQTCLPAIALTAYAGEFNQQQALRAGFQQHLAKPIDPEQLVTAIALLVSTRHNRSQPN